MISGMEQPKHENSRGTSVSEQVISLPVGLRIRLHPHQPLSPIRPMPLMEAGFPHVLPHWLDSTDMRRPHIPNEPPWSPPDFSMG
jgi:hypothetical protein